MASQDSDEQPLLPIFQHVPDKEVNGSGPSAMKKQPGASADVRAVHISGRSRRSADFYATPAWVTEALLAHIRFRNPIWEPCCGAGAISEVLAAHGYRVVSTDLMDHGYGTSGIDIFSCRTMPGDCCALVTNPPYGDTGVHGGSERSSSAMLDFVAHAINLTREVEGQVALLVRFQWIAGRRAASLMSQAPFSAVIALTRRIRWFEMGAQTNAAQHHHAWVVFDYKHPAGTPPVLLFAPT